MQHVTILGSRHAPPAESMDDEQNNEYSRPMTLYNLSNTTPVTS
jgi:hypothetical protein